MNTTSTYQVGSSLRCKLYLALTIVGSILPWVFLDQFLFSGNVSVMEFFAQAMTTSVSTALVTDLAISCLAFFCLAWFELKRLNLSRRWLWIYMGCTVGIGLSCSLPLFLYLRERQISSI